MPGMPPTQARLTEREPHEQRQVAESFGMDAERYDRTRPRYPDAMVERIVAASPGRDVLDVGTGTGIAVRQFQAAGCQVLGVEPDARMADLARQFGLEVEVAKFEDWDPTGRAFDAVIAAQAWHWIDPIVGAAKAEQALRPGGRLAVFQPPPEVAEAFSAVYRRVMPDPPIYWLGTAGPNNYSNNYSDDYSDNYSALCTKTADAIQQAGGLGDPEQWRFGWDQPYTRDEWLDQVPTFGGHNQLPAANLQELHRYRRRHRHAGGQLHDALHRVGAHCGANQCPLPRRGTAPDVVSTCTGWGRVLAGHCGGAGDQGVYVWGGVLTWQDHNAPGLGDVGLGEVTALAGQPVSKSLPGLFRDRDWWGLEPQPAKPPAEPLAAMPPSPLVL